jgi:hypothetical protein
MTINDFSGGLSKRLSPNLIQLNESTICTNVDITTGIIKPLKDLVATNKTIPINNPIFTYFKGTYLSSNSGTSYVEYNDKLYIANGIDTVKKTSDGITMYDVGLNNPTTKLTTTTSFSVTFTLSNILSGSTVTFDAGTYTYLIQYKTLAGSIKYEIKTFTYTGTRGIRLSISSFSNLESVTIYRKVDTKYRLVGESTASLTIDDTVFNISNKATTTPYEQGLGTRNYVYTYYSSITGFESAPSPLSDDLSVDINNVVVTGFVAPTDTTVDAIKLYRIGGTLTGLYSIATLAKTVTTYTDTKTDLQALDGELLTTTGFIKPPVGLKFLTEYNSALFGAIDSTLYFSNSGLVDQWTSDNWITFPEHITGLGVTQNGLLIFSRNKTWILVGDSLSTYSKYLLNGSQGCVSHSTIAYVDNNLLWYSLDGICVSQGGSIELLSYAKLGKVSVNPIIARVYENQYFLFHETGTIVVDFRGGAVKFLDLSLIVRGAYYSSSYDKLYILKPSDIGMFEYNSGVDLTFTYKTGWLAENGITNYKTYKNIYIKCVGSVNLDLILDGVVIKTYTLVNGINDIKYPQEYSKGYYTELLFYGTGKIIEVNFLTEGRQNGR